MSSVLTDASLISWSPQPGPQHALVHCPITEVLFGGARGGGKTDGVLGKWGHKSRQYGRGFNAVFFRKEMPQQDDLIERAKEIYGPTGAQWQEQKRMFLMPGGGRVRFRPLENTNDAEKYQGQNLSDAAVEEMGNYPDSAPIDRLFGCLRSSHGVPVQLIGTANPGGPGHHWIRQRYIDPAPMGMRVLERSLPNGRTHKAVYIPSRVENNQILLRQDPEYVSRLYLVGSPELVRAWLEGDWSVIEGSYFPEFDPARHVLKPFEVPDYWAKIRSGDWGSAKPFAFLWAAVSDGSLPIVPRGALLVYREWYGWNGKPNVGCKMTAEEVGAGIRAFEHYRREGIEVHEKIADAVLDPAAFTEDGGPSINERMGPNLNFRRADNKRIARQGAMGGWDQVRSRLKGNGEHPMLYVFSTCIHTIRTLPALQHDPHKPEDVDTDSEDHACFAAGTIVNGSRIEKVGSMTRSATQVLAVRFDDGTRIVCTPDHRFLASDGQWTQARHLTNVRVLSAPRSRSSGAFDIIAAGLTFSARALDCIAWCLSTSTVRYLMEFTFITWTRIGQTISRATWLPWQSSITCPYTVLTASSASQRAKQPNGGTAATPEEGGTRTTGIEVSRHLLKRVLRWCASNAGMLMRRAASRRLARDSVTQTAKHALCVHVEPLSERLDVWCIPTKKAWVSANGFIASNCDALRYLCMSRPWIKDAPNHPLPKWETQLTINQILKRQTQKRLFGE